MIINLSEQNNQGTNIEELQKETMESMKEYIGVLVPKMNGMIVELRGELKDDTWEFLRMMIDGFNWVIEAYNGTSSIINKDKSINEDDVQKAVDEFSEAFINQNPIKTADVIELKVIPFLEAISKCL